MFTISQFFKKDGTFRVSSSLNMWISAIRWMPEHIKEVGTHPVTLKFSPELSSTVNVVVVAEQDEDDTEAAPESEQEAQKL